MRPDYQRFVKPIEGVQFASEYDFGSDEIQDLIQREVVPFVLTTLDLSTAGSKLIAIPGRAVVPYFWQTSTTNKARALAGLVTCYMGAQDSSDSSRALQMKHNRGYRGSFSFFYLTWTAQANTSVDIVVLKSKRTPWMSDGINFALGGSNWGTPAQAVTVNQNGGSYTLSALYNLYLINSASPITVNLPAAASWQSAIAVKNIGAGAVTLVPNGVETIDGAASYVQSTQYDGNILMSDGVSQISMF